MIANTKDTALYIHIPFCDHKCVYCDFYSIIKSDKSDHYFDALQKEILYYSKISGAGRVIRTIFFGGGTPSLVDENLIIKLLRAISDNFSVARDAEITLEANPGTLTPQKITTYLSHGINRLSLGVQSFNEADLKFMTRIHDAATARSTVAMARKEGFENINIDLIFNLPGQDKEKWITNLEEAVSLPVTHISAYSLMLEKGTILNKMVLDGKVRISDLDYDAYLYESTIGFLKDHGFKQYEVSNFAKEGYECLHNKYYWEYQDYLGFGTSAHSFVNGHRWWNFHSLTFYLEAVAKCGFGKAGEEIISGEEMLEEYTMLALRSSGIRLKEFNEKFGSDWMNRNEALIGELIDEGFLLNADQTLRLTGKGYAVCDEILSRFN